MSTLSSKLIISLVDHVSGPARGISASLKGVRSSAAAASMQMAGLQARRAGQHFARAGGTALVAGYGIRALIDPTREFNESIWGSTAALLGQTKALKPAQAQAEDLRKTAINLSKAYGIMPEVFAKAGEEATKMGLNQNRSMAVMEAAGKIQMSDREADSATMAKSLGTYGIVYGTADDDNAYAKQVQERASMLALAGAQTRTSASKIEEGMRNFMGVHGAFGGRFEDAVALIAQGSQSGLQEKETGTALKSLTTRFLRMPSDGRAALAGAGIDLNKFMDFSAVDPTRATNNLIQAFPQQLKKGARGNTLKFLEKAQRDGRLKDPEIINETLQHLEKQGLKFAGSEDRDAAATKIAAIMHGAGGNFDPLALFTEVQRAIDDGRAGPGVMAAIGEPKRLHQYLALIKTLSDAKRLRDELVQDQGRYIDLVADGYQESDAGKIVAMEAAWRRFNLALVRSEGLQAAVKMLATLGEAFAGMPSWIQNGIGGFVALAAALTPIAFALRGMVASLRAFRIGLSTLAKVAGLGGATAAGGAGLAEVFGVGAAGAVGATKGGKLVAKGMSAAGAVAAEKAGADRMIAGMTGGAAATGTAAKAGGFFSRFGMKAAGKLGAKLAARLLPGVGLGLLGYNAYEGYQKDGWKGAILNPLTLGMYSSGARAETAAPSPASTIAATGPAIASGTPVPAGTGTQSIAPAAAGIPAAIDGVMGQVRSIVASVDLTAEGQRIAESLADGIRSGIGAIQAAASAAAAAAAQNAVRGAYADGVR